MNRLVLIAFTLAGSLAAAAVLAQPPLVSDLGPLPGDAGSGIAVNSQQDHSIARGGDQYLVAWSDYRAQSSGSSTNQSGGDVFGVRLDANGQPIDARPFLIAGGMGVQNRPLVAWNGTAWLVLYVSQDPVGGYYENVVRAVRVSATGQVLDATPIGFPPTTFSPSTVGLQLAGLDGQWLVTRCLYHEDGYGTYLAGQRIAGDGRLLDTTPRVLIDWVYGSTVALTANGEYLVAGLDWSNSANARARRIGTNGQPLAPEFSVPSLQLASSGSEYYVVWIKDYVNLVGSRLTTSGTLLTPQGTPIVSNFSSYTHSTLTHDGTLWWLEWGVSDLLHTVRINSAGTVLDAGGGPLLPITIGGNVNTAYSVMLAPRAGGGILVLWYDLRVALGYDTNVWVLPVSPSNVPGTERAVSTSTRNQRTPDLCAGPGASSALVFVSELADDRRVMLQMLDGAGQPTGPAPIEVASAPVIGRASVAWNGSLYLVAWDAGASGQTPTQVRARRLNAAGTFVDAVPLDVMPGFSPDVEALGEDFLVACARYATYPQNIHAWMRILDGPTGAFQNTATLLGGGYVNDGPRVRRDGTQWMVTYHSHWSHDNSASDAIYHFVSAGGSFTPARNPATTSGGSGTPDVAFSGDKYLFVWRNNSLSNANNYIAGRVMNADGTFATSNFTIAEAAGRQLRPVVGWDGTNFLVAYEDQRNQQSFFDERTDVYATRVSESGVVLDPAGFAVHAGPQGDAGPSLLARPGGHALVAATRFLTAPPFDSYRIGLTRVGEGATLDAPPTANGRLSLETVMPNPLRTRGTLAYVLPRSARVDLAVHDLQGRVVRTLLRGTQQPAGRHTAAWDGRDDAGARVAPGVYLAGLRTPDGAAARRVVVLGE